MIRTLLMTLLLMLGTTAVAYTPIEFRSEAEEIRYHALLHELRCLMCQNQSLADSPSHIAGDLRTQVVELMREGMNDREIKAYLVERYGDFILYQPPITRSTWLLWFGPGLVLLGGAVAVILTVRRKSAALPDRRSDIEDDQEW